MLFLGWVLFCLFVWVFALLLSSVSCLVCVGFLSSYGDSSMDLSILPSSTFGAHCLYYHVAIALLRGIEICNWLSGLLNDLARAICVGRKKGFFFGSAPFAFRRVITVGRKKDLVFLQEVQRRTASSVWLDT